MDDLLVLFPEMPELEMSGSKGAQIGQTAKSDIARNHGKQK